MAAAVVGNATIAMIRQEDHLELPVVTVQWPSMREDDSWSIFWTPDLVVDLGAILDGDVRHVGELDGQS
jgi:hypothetical protein